jgi:hypothetical protein
MITVQNGVAYYEAQFTINCVSGVQTLIQTFNNSTILFGVISFSTTYFVVYPLSISFSTIVPIVTSALDVSNDATILATCEYVPGLGIKIIHTSTSDFSVMQLNLKLII